MVDAELLPAPFSFDDPGFDAYLDEIMQLSNANPPEPDEEDLSHLVSMQVGTMATTSGPARSATPHSEWPLTVRSWGLLLGERADPATGVPITAPRNHG